MIYIGPANPPSWSNQQPQQWDQANQQLPMSGQFQQGPMPQDPYDQQQQQPQFQNGTDFYNAIIILCGLIVICFEMITCTKYNVHVPCLHGESKCFKSKNF